MWFSTKACLWGEAAVFHCVSDCGSSVAPQKAAKSQNMKQKG